MTEAPSSGSKPAESTPDEFFRETEKQFTSHLKDDPKYSEHAAADYGLAVAVYASKLRLIAESKSKSEMVLAEHVGEGVKELGPDTADALGAGSDWIKRMATVLIGAAIAQGVSVSHQGEQIARGSVVWLGSLIGISICLAAFAAGLDFPKIKNFVSDWRRRKRCPVCGGKKKQKTTKEPIKVRRWRS